jgi:hypothetical protein
MASYLSENLNERETITDGPARLNGWHLSNTGNEARFVAFKEGDRTVSMIVIPAGDAKSIAGLDEPYPGGLAVESVVGDGKLTANVFYEIRPVLPPVPEVE